MHCLAGRGRTGTAISIMNAMMTIQAQIGGPKRIVDSNTIMGKKLSVFSIVRRLREQRSDCVQTKEQYAYIYQFIYRWVENKAK